MVVNHAGFAWLGGNAAHEGWTGLLVFLGSLAPVFFFFATGAGAGLKPPGQPTHWRALLEKAAWLLLADQFLLWSHGLHWGMDFFGFIALSMLAVAWVADRSSPRAWAICLSVLLLGIRYANRDAVAALTAPYGVLVWLTGVSGQPGWSYPLSPWLVAPLAGFVAARSLPQASPRAKQAATLACATGGGLLTAWLYAHGASFFRWGSVSAGFLLVSVTSLVLAWWTCHRLASIAPGLAKALSLRGAAALLVVPLHYAALAVLAIVANIQAWPAPAAIVLAFLLAGLCLPLARRLSSALVSQVWLAPRSNLTVILLLLAVLAWAPIEAIWLSLTCCFGQMLISSRFSGSGKR
jgi:hypothetical protein